ncbi:hypothetical protein AAHA92_00309 [Salvia divinorum]|uniref:Uncharacterized protein n=1 Tax=Salvia divinorum TaxID=28513 RepID=A0ABD1ILN6_SALDI
MLKLKDRQSTSGGGKLSATAHAETRSKKIHDHVEKPKERVQDDANKAQDDEIRTSSLTKNVRDAGQQIMIFLLNLRPNEKRRQLMKNQMTFETLTDVQKR